MKTYAEKLTDPRWQRLRLEIMSRDEFKCRLCFCDGSTLAVHHKKYSETGNPWDAAPDDLVTLCQTCHEKLHTGTVEKIPDAIGAFYRALTRGQLANSSDALISEIETASEFYEKAMDLMESAISPLQYRLHQLIEKGAEKA